MAMIWALIKSRRSYGGQTGCLACSSETGQLYVQGKIDVEPILGKLKASLRS